MKNVTKILALSLVLIMTVVMLASCGGPSPELDMKKAADALEDDKWDVVKHEKGDDARTLASSYLRAGASEGVKEILYAIEDTEDYDTMLVIITFDSSAQANTVYDYLKKQKDMSLEQTKATLEYYKNLLKNFEDDLDNDDIDELEDDIKDLEEAIEEYADENILGKNGATIWIGTKDAIEASKG